MILIPIFHPTDECVLLPSKANISACEKMRTAFHEQFCSVLKEETWENLETFLLAQANCEKENITSELKSEMFLFFLAFRDEHERQFMRERGMAVYRNHTKNFLGPGSSLAALGLITGLQLGCQQESCMISSSAKWAIYCGTGEGVLSVKFTVGEANKQATGV